MKAGSGKIKMAKFEQNIMVRPEDIISCVICHKPIPIGEALYMYNPEDRGMTRLFICEECGEENRRKLYGKV